MSELCDNNHETSVQIKSDILIAEIEVHLDRIAKEDESTLSGDLDPVGDAIAFHERMETIRWWLSTPFEEEVEEDEEA